MIRILFFKLGLGGALMALLGLGASTPFLASATVVRSCKVATSTNVVLECSRSVNRVSVTTVGALTSSFSISQTPVADIRSLVPGENSVGGAAAQPVPDQADSVLAANIEQPVMVTLNF